MPELPRLSSRRARHLVIGHLEVELELAVWELRAVEGVTLPHFAILRDGALVPVQVQVGKRPPRSRGLSVDKRRVPDLPGLLIAVVDPLDHAVHLVTRSEALRGPLLAAEGPSTREAPEGPEMGADGAEAADED